MFREIIIDLSILRYIVSSCVKEQRYDINHDCENFYCGLLNLLWNKNFVNTNTAQRNSAGIDLADDSARIAVQVTSNISSQKIQSTLDKFVDHGLRAKYDEIYMLYIDSKPKFDKKRKNAVEFKFKDNGTVYDDEKYLIDVQDLLHQIEPLDAIKMGPIADHVKNNLGYYKIFLKDSSSLLDCEEFQSKKHSTLAGIAKYIDAGVKKNFDKIYERLEAYSSKERKVIICFMKKCTEVHFHGLQVNPNTLANTAHSIGLTDADIRNVAGEEEGTVIYSDGEVIKCYFDYEFKILLAINEKLWHRLIVRLDFSLLDATIDIDGSKLNE